MTHIIAWIIIVAIILILIGIVALIAKKVVLPKGKPISQSWKVQGYEDIDFKSYYEAVAFAKNNDIDLKGVYHD